MKKIIIALLIVVMTFTLFAPAVSADANVIGTLNYSVSPTTVTMTNGVGSFDINVPDQTTGYAGFEVEIELPAGAEITSVDYNQIPAGVNFPDEDTPPGGRRPNARFYGFFTTENKNILTGEVDLTINVEYHGTTNAAVKIISVKQYRIRDDGAEFTDDYVSDGTKEVMLDVTSTDATLSDLRISSGTLSPAFNPSTTIYTATVSNSVSSVTVTATPRHTGAKATVSGASSLSLGTNTITIVVTAEDTTAPTKTYTIIVTRRESGGGNPPAGEEITDPNLPLAGFPFTDVKEGDWFYGNVYYVWEKGLMNGTSATLFSPNSVLSRGMVVTVLYRNEGNPDVAALSNPFSDVAADQWYSDAVKWAADKGIILGYGNGNFGPNDNVTREQLAAILHRYAGYAEALLPETRAYTGFNDDASLSEYAKAPVIALYRAEIINGEPNNLFNPKGPATRAQFAAMIHRFLEV